MTRLTVGQALIRFLANQYSERDGAEHRLIAGCSGIFGHGNVAGVGQALLEAGDAMPYRQARNEQGMVHTAVGFARINRRLSTLACTTSIGPGATNMITGAALATVNRLPVLLLPSDVFATRVADPVLQQIELPWSGDLSVNDAFRPVSRFFDRVWRPEMLIPAALQAMRVLTDPAETGAVTLALPQDVQAEAFDFPDEFLARRVWHVARPEPETSELNRAVDLIRAARRPVIVAGGGIVYSDATAALRALVDATGIPVGESQAGKGSLPFDHPSALGAVGATGTAAANAIAHDADLVIGVGTRWSDFTTASHSVFANPDVRFININIAAFDSVKLSGLAITADARQALTALTAALTGWQVAADYREDVQARAAAWQDVIDVAYRGESEKAPLAQTQVLGAVNAAAATGDVVVNAAGSMPGDLHMLWRASDPLEYHVEYGFSCMGYEIAGGLGVRLGDPGRDVFVMVGDGSYLMLAQELVTAVQEGIKLIVVLVQNHGYASIGSLSESVGSQRFGTSYRFRNVESHQLDGDIIPVDLAANAESLGAQVIRAGGLDDLKAALATAKAASRTTVIHVETDPLAAGPDSSAWWDVPVAEVSTLDTTREARAAYERDKRSQRHYL
ncbi:MAG TPA: 3D-(3,5/4)-trihydroxycyclohexane-1,2-dione acylhydrolase (decyclizing) [Mycobacteriales bacterium]|jgi:3D-(3,5/4)-trihydroxycyclohexane-1,2-dione acylhydrolase (decyclizing)|nr:3D-(3,5/4)-trihydroxycyclohexane-1,2-dione acylhydrolase (decyclizing) [Mycobacteriales bacterium]